VRAVWKFKLADGVDHFALDMPVGATILSVQVQNGEPCMWALIPDTSGDREMRVFRIYETGHSMIITEKLLFLGTIQQPPYVWHLFEVAQP
jgi:hypothetical protein